jgi:drug/metabolite transporter (DMT)-like permease
MIVGIPMAFFGEDNYFFFIMGLAFTIIGLANKDKWKKNRVRWKNLKKPEKIIQGILIAILAFLIAAGIAFLLMR